MPICNQCERMKSTAEMRRSKKEGVGYVCRDKDRCKERRNALRKERK